MKPKRPYKNLDEYRISRIGVYARDKKHDTGFWPCFKCSGEGEINGPRDFDVYESHPTWHKCTHCNGTGRGTREYCAAMYRRAIEKWREECKEYDQAKKLIESAKSKLTPEEIKALRI